MIKSYTRAAKEAIKKYIIDSASEYLTECEYITEGATYDQIKDAIARAFIKEKMTNYASAKETAEVLKWYYNNNLFAAFTDWGQGLSCGALFDYFCGCSAVDLVGGWLQETEEERNKFDEDDAEEYATQLLFRELHGNIIKYIF